MNVCVIGLGSMGRRRIKLLLKCEYVDDIIGIDNNAERAKAISDEYGIDTYLSLEDVKTELDCAFVCTSPQSHGVIIKDCLKKGMNIFSEINLVCDLYDENIRAAKEKDKILFLSSTPLYKAEMQIIDKKVKEDGTTCVYQYHVGQYLPDWHPWDNLNEFFISQQRTNGCRELFAIELPWLQNTFGTIMRINVIKRKITSMNIDFPDTYLVQIEHVNGNAGSLTIDVVSRHAVRYLEVFNENMYIRWNGTPDSLYEKNIASGELEQIPAGEYIHERGYGDFINEYAYMKEIEGFFHALQGELPLYSFEQDKKILSLIDEIES